MSDRNYVSVAGRPDGWLQLVDYRQPEGKTHRMLREAGDLSFVKVDLGYIQPPPGQWDDALKVSGAVNCHIHADYVAGGREDVVDVNHSDHVIITIGKAVPRGKYVGTIKGGSSYIDLRVAVQIGHGTETDYDFDNWSDQSHAPTEGCRLRSRLSDDSPARVRQLGKFLPDLDPECKWDVNKKWKSIFLPAMKVWKGFLRVLDSITRLFKK